MSCVSVRSTLQAAALPPEGGTTNDLGFLYVLAEFVPLTRVRGLSREKSLNFLRDFVLLPQLELVWIDERRHQEAMDLLHHRMDKAYSLCDAVSFVLMREHRINEALTTDKHFVQEGFTRLLEP